MAYTAIDDPEAYFQVKTYTGTGSAASITLDGDTDMQPDFVWIKIRSTTNQHRLLDSIRGSTNELYSDLTSKEETTAQGLTAFDSDGFSLGTDHGFNKDTETFVAWCWKANGSGSANTDGSINSTVSVNTTAGFSIVKWTGDGSTGATVGHGLGVVPKMIIMKNLTESSRHWQIYHESIGNTHYFQFDTNAKLDDAGCFDDTSPTSSVFTLGSANRGNEDTKSFIAYCFAEKQGYSKIGSYTGNNSTDGTFVYTGFRPAWVLLKISLGTTGSWALFDSKRDVDNPVDKRLFPDSGGAEDPGNDCDLLSNGFKHRTTGSGTNGDGYSYTYMAFAEAPFVNSNGVPCNAR